MTDRVVDTAASMPALGQDMMSFTGLVMQADIVVQLVMLLLLLTSFWSWALIIDKWRYLKRHKKKLGVFEKTYRASKALSQLYARSKKNIDNPMTAMFVAGMYEINEGLLKDVKHPSGELQQKARERIFFALERVKNKALEKMEKDLIVLATVGGAAPFVGLFGTVWGIVHSFQAIAAANNTTLAVVAPGIAEALLATAIGLFAAIPAVVAYNFFSNEIRRVSMKLEDFSHELSAVLALSLDKTKEK